MLYPGMVCLQVCQNQYIYTLDVGRSLNNDNNYPSNVPRSQFFTYVFKLKRT